MLKLKHSGPVEGLRDKARVTKLPFANVSNIIASLLEKIRPCHIPLALVTKPMSKKFVTSMPGDILSSKESGSTDPADASSHTIVRESLAQFGEVIQERGLNYLCPCGRHGIVSHVIGKQDENIQGLIILLQHFLTPIHGTLHVGECRRNIVIGDILQPILRG
jgi:hypothetical protein